MNINTFKIVENTAEIKGGNQELANAFNEYITLNGMEQFLAIYGQNAEIMALYREVIVIGDSNIDYSDISAIFC